jgi:hypothetical protein
MPDRTNPLSAPPQIRSATGVVAQHSRFDQFSCMMLWKLSGGAIDVSNAADGSDNVKDLFVDTYPTEDLLGDDTVTWATSDTEFARLIALKINQKSAGHHYWATSVTDHVFIWPKNPWIADAGVITVDDTSFTAAVANMDIEQPWATGIRVISGQSSGIPGTSMYAIGFDNSNLPLDVGAYMGYEEGNDDRPTLDGRKPGRFNLQTQSPWKLTFSSGQITNWYDMGGGLRSLAADTDRVRNIFQWREYPMFVQAAAAATPTYEVASY